MRVVTFYSFKGGVGRTMALLNVAAALVQRGRRVLLVDFDLEAPGIQTYQPFAENKSVKGVVDYVTSYLQNAAAPKVSEYLSEYAFGGGSIWLMPAGLQDQEYAARLNSIEWLRLYNEHDGYLMFEDLKQQWASHEFDYVLIDSRTGHTDIAGICTRQLPEAVVLMFLPNNENISGLEDVVRNIRLEAKPPRSKDIYLHFCPSNIPNLDDEDLILQRHLDDARTRLECKSFASAISHYNNLALLDQVVFVQSRPRTRLAEEYRHLAESIIAENLEDRDGALSKLEEIRVSLRASRTNQDLGEIDKTINTIYKHHNKDGEVAWSLSLVYEMLSNIEAQLEALDIAIRQKFNEPRARTKRAQILLRDPSSKVGRDDLRHVLSSKDVSLSDLVSTIERLREIDREWLKGIRESNVVKKLGGADLDRVSNSLITSRDGAVFAAEILQDALKVSKDARGLKMQLGLALIGSGQFLQAMQLLGPDRSSVLKSNSVADVFNYACADWGHYGTPSAELFSRAIDNAKELMGHFDDPNFLQCIAMANYVTGKINDAHELLVRSNKLLDRTPPQLIFSCWRYLYVKRADFAVDLEEMRSDMEKGRLIPKYMEEPSLLAPT